MGDEDQLCACLERCKREDWPPIRGVIQGAMALNDAAPSPNTNDAAMCTLLTHVSLSQIYETMSREQFLGTTRGKVHGSRNLHKHLPRDMDFFVLLSSSVGIAGSRAQCNYSAGNSFQDALAHHRRSSQPSPLPACSIDVGMALGVGFLAEETTDGRVHENTSGWSFIGTREREFLAILQAGITGESVPGAGPAPIQMITGLGTGGMMAQGSQKYPWWFNDAKFAHIVTVDTQVVAGAGGRGLEGDQGRGKLRDELVQAASAEAAAEIVMAALVQKLARSMMVSVDKIEVTRSVSSYGVDSLLAVELRSWIYEEIQAEVSVFDLLSDVAISSLTRTIVAGSKLVSTQ